MSPVMRLVSAFCVFALLVLTGLQAAHSHPVSAPDTCGVCAFAGNATRHVASATPAPAFVGTSAPIAPKAAPSTNYLRFIDVAARAPPSVA